MTTKTYWVITVVFAFVSAISFFQINSYWADKHHFNGGWTIIGIIAGLIAIYGIYKVSKDWGSGKPER